MEVLKVEELKKRYSKKSDLVVKGVSLSCGEGEIVGLLGHNGAGKSTVIKCIEGVLPFESGSISILGKDIKKDPVNAKKNMGFVTDNHAVFTAMTGVEYINFLADIYGVSTEDRKARLSKLQEVFRLGDPIYNLISSYSHGMKQKISMIGSLIHQPKLWILDEPMLGLDPITMNAVIDYMRDYASQGNGIVFSSHNLSTVQKLCDRVVIIKKGTVVLNINLADAEKEGKNIEEIFLNEY
ncbi:MAG: ABC transporter ATP-binding protein [Eubacteriales bacterium]|nr:ABC transporter ATP-binding protein [Eubacteriales bacterium]